MTAANFPRCLSFTFAQEGGLSLDKRDPGNWTGGKVGKGELKGTKYGIAASQYPHLDIASLTLAEAGEIYRAKYWDAVKGDRLPAGVDLVTWDFGVNSGPSRGIKALQAAVGVPADGVIGPLTINEATQQNGKRIIQAVCAKRSSFLRGLKTWATFGKGWSKRVAACEALGVKMWLEAMPAGAPSPTAMQDEADKAKDKAASQTKTSGSVGGAGGAGGAIVVANEPNWLLIAAVAAVVIGAVVFFAYHAAHNRERAKAYAALAA